MQIAIGNSRMDKHWKNVDMSWEEFKERCSQTTRTAESLSEYKKMTKARQDAIKDVGGFVAGNLKEGRRKNGYVNYRSALTLDLDHAVPGVWDTVSMLFDFKCLMYSTHKSTAENPTSTISDMPKSHNSNSRLEDTVLKIIEMEHSIDDEIDRLVDLKAEASMQIFLMEDPRCRLILESRYLNGEAWETIAAKMGYTVRNVQNLHGKALQEFQVPERCRESA